MHQAPLDRAEPKFSYSLSYWIHHSKLILVFMRNVSITDPYGCYFTNQCELCRFPLRSQYRRRRTQPDGSRRFSSLPIHPRYASENLFTFYIIVKYSAESRRTVVGFCSYLVNTKCLKPVASSSGIVYVHGVKSSCHIEDRSKTEKLIKTSEKHSYEQNKNTTVSLL